MSMPKLTGHHWLLIGVAAALVLWLSGCGSHLGSVLGSAGAVPGTSQPGGGAVPGGGAHSGGGHPGGSHRHGHHGAHHRHSAEEGGNDDHGSSDRCCEDGHTPAPTAGPASDGPSGSVSAGVSREV